MRFFFFILMAIQTSLLLSGCKSSSNDESSTFGQQMTYEKVLRFEQYMTHTSGISCGITLDKKVFCNDPTRVKQKVSLFELGIPSAWPAKKMEGGRFHACAIFEGPLFDEVWCQGTGTSGQLGDGTLKTSKTFVKVSGLPETRIVDIASENTSMCAVTEEKEVYCWGSGYRPGAGAGIQSTALQTNLTNVIAISGTYLSYCALKEDRSVWCWGSGGTGNLGQGNTASSLYTPLQVKNTAGNGFLEDVDSLTVGYGHVCALISEDVYCWGTSKSVGVNQVAATTLPRHLPELSGIVKIKAGDFYTCALSKLNEFYCWGRNNMLQMSATSDKEVILPTKVNFPEGVGEIVDFSLGTGSNPSTGRVCVVNKKGELYCWGAATSALFGTVAPLIAKNFELQPQQNISSIQISNSQFCFIENGKPYLSGFNDYSQIVHDRHIIGTPVLLVDETVTNFNCSRYANCFVSDNKMFCRGLSYTNVHEITALGQSVSKAVLASHTSCALMNDKKLYCWGTNSNGQVGNGQTTTVSFNTPYLTMTDVESATGGMNFLCALKSDNTVWCWGNNGYGAVGHNKTEDSFVTTPTLVQGLPDLSSAQKLSLVANNETVCLKADSDIYCWGNDVGRLLSLETDFAPKAYKISALSGKIEKMAVINHGVCASYSDNSVSCFAEMDSFLFVEDQKTIRKQSYPSIGEIEELAGGSYLLCQRLKNGRMYCLGNNSYGGMAHSKISPPLILNPEKWLP